LSQHSQSLHKQDAFILVLLLSIYQLLQAVLMLKPEEQLELFHQLEESLFARGILAPPA
jgi:hypothetical protein